MTLFFKKRQKFAFVLFAGLNCLQLVKKKCWKESEINNFNFKRSKFSTASFEEERRKINHSEMLFWWCENVICVKKSRRQWKALFERTEQKNTDLTIGCVNERRPWCAKLFQ